MKHQGILISLFLLLGGLFEASRAQVVINELMQSNIDCIMDDLCEFPDSWVELYNETANTVSMDAYTLLNEDGNIYHFPTGVSLAPHAYLLVYCDKQNQGLHTAFRLESGKGGRLYLNKYGAKVDSVVGLKKQPAPNVAYGRATDGGTEWGYQAIATPGAVNSGLALSDVCLDAPIFSIEGQVLTAQKSRALYLSLPQTAPSGATIRYTTDGSEPTATHGTVYTQPLTIDQTTVVRAKVVCQGYLSPRATVHSYIYLNREMKMPVISITTDSRYLNDPQIGIYVEGNKSDGLANYSHNWRRPIQLELYDSPASPSQLNQLCEARIMGGASRGCVLKSLALYANKRFGTKQFEYELFPDQRPGITNYRSFQLRNAGNDFDYLYMRDAIIQRSVAQHVDIDWQAWRPAIVYINGVYRGMLNIRERSNDDNIYTNYNGLENITMMENFWNLKAGNWGDWEQFKTFFSGTGHSWQEYQQVMDCKEYINYMVMQLFYDNADFPSNNMIYWRPREVTDELPARWRFLAKDTEYGMGLYGGRADYPTFSWFYTPGYDSSRDWGNSTEATALFRNAMDNADFRREFVEHAAVYVGDFLTYDKVWPMWKSMYEQIQEEWGYHRPLYNRWWPNYQDELNAAKNWLRQRPHYFIQQMAEFYNLGEMVPMQINTKMPSSTAEQLHLTFSAIAIPSGIWDGWYISPRDVTLRVEPEADADFMVDGWRVEYTMANTKQTYTYSGAQCLFSIPAACKLVSIETIVRQKQTGEEMLREHNADDSAEKRIENGQLIILRDGRKYTVQGVVVGE